MSRHFFPWSMRASRLRSFFRLIILIVAVLLFLYSGEDKPILCGPYSLLYVIDGDTLVLDIDGEAVTVRLIGVDAPESIHPDKTRNSPEGEDASRFLRSFLKESDGQVYLEYDVQRYDAYGRTLAYVYLSDRKTMLQEILLCSGMARPLEIPPNRKYVDLFYKNYFAGDRDGYSTTE